MGFLCVRATELAGRVPRPEGNCVDSRLHVGFHVLDGIGSDVFSSIHTPAVPARWSTGGSFYFPIGNSRGGWKCIIFCWRKLLGYEPEGAYAY